MADRCLIRPRDSIGRFDTLGGITEAKRQKRQQGKSYSARKELIKNQIFEKFIQVFFLLGSAQDWLPASRKSGPLVNLAQCLFKPTFLLSQGVRDEELNLMFSGGDPRDVRPVRKRITTRDATVAEGPTSRIRIFAGRRLPLIANYWSEVEPVRDWVIKHYELGFLKVRSWEEGLSICIDAIKSYVMINGKRAYNGYPKILRQSSSSTSGGSSNESSSDLVNNDETNSDPATSSQQLERQPVVARGETGRLVQDAERASALAEENGNRTSLLHAPLDKSTIIFYVARDDNAFFNLCLLFDKDVSTRYKTISGPFLENDRRGEEIMDPIVRDILVYAQWECFGIKKLCEHEDRLEGLRSALDVATKARVGYGFKPYSEMRLMYLS